MVGLEFIGSIFSESQIKQIAILKETDYKNIAILCGNEENWYAERNDKKHNRRRGGHGAPL